MKHGIACVEGQIGLQHVHARLTEDANDTALDMGVNQLADQARLDAGRMSVDSRDFDLRLLLSQTARLWAGPARAL